MTTMLNALKRFIYACLLVTPTLLQAHEAHEHGSQPQGAALAVSLALDEKGTLWRVGVEGGHVIVQASTDMGRTFGQPRKLNANPQKIGTDGDARPKIAIGPEGNLYVTWTQALAKPYSGYIWFSRSTDGGRTFSQPLIVHRDRAEITHRFDALTVARNGRIYVAWVDKRDLHAAQANKQAYAGAAIYYAYSDDGGLTFKEEQNWPTAAASAVASP